MNDHQEYLRRNRILGRAEGAKAALAVIDARAPKRTPAWLRTRVLDALTRMESVIKELAAHRDEVGP